MTLLSKNYLEEAAEDPAAFLAVEVVEVEAAEEAAAVVKDPLP